MNTMADPDRNDRAPFHRDVLERVTDGIVTVDPDFRYTYVNKRAEEILGKDRSELLDRRVWDVFPEAAGTEGQDKMEEALATQQRRSFERYNSELGRWFEVRVYPDEHGLSLYFTDVTERTESKRELKRANRQLTALIENTSEAVYIKDRDGYYQRMNDAAAELFGLKPDEAVGKRDEDLFDAKSAADIRDVDEQILERGEADTREAVRYIDGEKHVFLDNKYPYRDQDGNVVGIMGISRDISARKQRQAALHRRKQRLQVLFDESPDAVIIHDAEGTVLDVNDQTLHDLGYTREELLSMNVSEFEVGIDREELRSIWTSMDVGDRDKGEGRHRRKDGSTFPVEVWVNKVEIDGAARFVAVSRDVTEREMQKQELVQTNTLLATLLENMPIGVLAETENREIVAANETLCDIFGLSSSCDELMGRDCAQASEQMKDRFADPEEFVAQIETRIDRRETVLNEELRLADGRTLVRSYVPYSQPSGNGSLWLYRDVTARKNRTRELERQEFLFKRAQEIANLGVWEYDLETADLTWSDGVRAIHGVDPSYDPTLEEALQFYHPEDREAITAAVERAMEEGELYDLDLRIIRADGETRNVRARGEVVTDQDGETTLLRGVFQDITEHKRREKTLRKLTGEYEALLQNAEDAIFLIDVEAGEASPTFRYERLNPYHETTSGLTTREVRGRTPREVLGDSFGTEVEANYRRCVQQREPVSYEEELPGPEGNIVWQTKLAPVIVNDEVTRMVGISRDVTERVRQERELRRKNERLDEFASVVSHDLRNPLNIALGRTTLAQEELARKDVESEHLRKVEKALDRMESIIMDTLILARRGETVAETESISLPDLVGRCWDMVDTEGVSLEIEDTFTLRGDQERLRHVFENLFRNAVQHGKDGGIVWVGRADGKTMYVEDDGPGIPEAQRADVFEPGQTSSSEGTGFGLTIVKRIAEAHGWQVGIVEGRTDGARFEFSGVEIDP